MARLGERAGRLTVIGDGPERQRLAALADDLGVEISLVGDAGRDAVATAMARAAVVVVPSTYPEPLGLVAIEAMAAGAIVVASAVGGLVESVADGVSGLLVDPGDPETLALAIERGLSLANDPSAGGAMRTAGLAVARQHDVRRAAAASLAWYGTLRR